jgi:hypothetical protein
MPTHFSNLSKLDELVYVALSELAQAPALPAPAPAADPAPAPVPEPPPTPASSVPAFPDLDTHRERRKLAQVMLRIGQLEQSQRKRQKRQKAAASSTPKHSRGALSVKTLLGKFVLKAFSGQMYRGRVTRVSTATGTAVYKFRPGLTSAVKCLVRYEDGDSEHMTPAEVERLLDPSKLCT